jgi:hypothetical protein
VKRAVALLIVVACNQRSEAPAPAPAPRPAPAPIAKAMPEIVAPPDAAPVAIIAAPDAARPDAHARTRDDAAALQDEAARYADALVGQPDYSDVSGTISKRAPGADLGAQLAEMRDRDANVRVGGGSARPVSGSGRAVPKSEAGIPPGRISVARRIALDDSTLGVDDVLSKIEHVYMAGLKRCYKDALAQDPTSSGSVTFRFLVNESGRARDGRVTGMDATLTACLAHRVETWVFSVPKDRDGDPMTAEFELQLRLVPE